MLTGKIKIAGPDNFFTLSCSSHPSSMKKAVFERNVVVVLFLMVLVIFSFAQKDSKKIAPLYTNTASTYELPKQTNLTSSALKETRNFNLINR